MAVLRNQDYFTVDIGTLAAGTPTQVLLPRPRTTPALSNTIDHVVNPATRREWEAGVCIVEIDAAALLADLLLTAVDFVRDADNPFTEAPEPAGSAAEPLFPSGAPTPDLVRSAFADATGVAIGTTPAQSLVDFLANLSVDAEEQVRLTVLSPGGGAGGTLRVGYDLGKNKAEFGLRALN